MAYPSGMSIRKQASLDALAAFGLKVAADAPASNTMISSTSFQRPSNPSSPKLSRPSSLEIKPIESMFSSNISNVGQGMTQHSLGMSGEIGSGRSMPSLVR